MGPSLRFKLHKLIVKYTILQIKVGPTQNSSASNAFSYILLLSTSLGLPTSVTPLWWECRVIGVVPLFPVLPPGFPLPGCPLRFWDVEPWPGVGGGGTAGPQRKVPLPLRTFPPAS